MSSEETPGVLNLAGADTSGFDAIPSARYNARIERVSWEKTKGGEDAKMPAGTPMLNVAFVVSEGEYENRWVWTSFVLPPENYDETKRNRMRGNFVNFLKACGYSEEEVTAGSFELDLDDLLDKEVTINVGQREYNGEIQNTVRSVRPLGEAQTESSGLL